VEQVAGHLASAFGKERVLYDNYHEAEFARPNLDVYLPELYRERSELVVLFLYPEYAARVLWVLDGWLRSAAGAAELRG